MIGGDLLQLLLSSGLLVVCLSYLFLGCAGGRRRGGEEPSDGEGSSTGEQSNVEGGSQAGSQAGSQVASEAGGSKKKSKVQPSESIAGYQSQTSEILAGPGNVTPSEAAAGAKSKGSSSVGHAADQSRIGSTLQGSHAASTQSKFGSTMDSAMSSRAAGGPSVMSMLSKHGSNIHSTVSRGGSHLGSTMDSALNQSRHGHHHSQAASVLSAVDPGRRAGAQSKLGSTLSSPARSQASSAHASHYSRMTGSNLSGASHMSRSPGSTASAASSGSSALSGTSGSYMPSGASSASRASTPGSTASSHSVAAASKINRATSTSIRIEGVTPVSNVVKPSPASTVASARSVKTTPSSSHKSTR